MRKIFFILFSIVFEMHLLGQDTVRFDKIYEESPHCGFPFSVKGKEFEIKNTNIDTFSMKIFFGIEDFEGFEMFYNYDTEKWSYGDFYIKDIWINTSWAFGDKRCFVLSSYDKFGQNPDGDYITYICVTSDKGILIDKLTINEGGEEEGKYRAYIVVDENTVMTFCYEINWSYENKIRANVNVENESPTIVFINEYKITEEGKFKLSNQTEVFVRGANGNYILNQLKLADDPFYEYLNKIKNRDAE